MLSWGAETFEPQRRKVRHLFHNIECIGEFEKIEEILKNNRKLRCP